MSIFHIEPDAGPVCKRCGQTDASLEMFCRKCGMARVGAFGLIVAIEIGLFALMAILVGIARLGSWWTLGFLAPSFYVGQLGVIYFLLAARRQNQFFIPMSVFAILMIVGAATPELMSASIKLAPPCLAVGIVALWLSRRTKFQPWEGPQTVWLAMLAVGWGLVGLLRLSSGSHHGDSVGRGLQGALQRYVPWFSLAGVIVTVAVRAIIQ